MKLEFCDDDYRDLVVTLHLTVKGDQRHIGLVKKPGTVSLWVEVLDERTSLSWQDLRLRWTQASEHDKQRDSI